MSRRPTSSSPARRLLRALAVGGGIAAVLGMLHGLGIGLPLLFGLATVIGIVAFFTPAIALSWLSDLRHLLRQRYWRGEQGWHHSFEGVPLHIEDDGRHVWIDGIGLQGALGTQEPDAVRAARLSDRWRRDASGRLMLRVDAVARHLATAPGRMERRRIRLRLYLERQILFPAGQRRAYSPVRPQEAPDPLDPPASRRQ